MREALAFLTPLGGARRPTPAALRWFPVVGFAIGLGLGALWWLVAEAWPAPVAAAIVVAADLAVTGLLHVDGLADAADGLLPHLTRPRRLEVMDTPGVGAFAIAVVAVTMVARFAALSTLHPTPLLLAGLWCASRTGMAATVDRLPYARPAGGLARAFQGAKLPLAAVVAAAAVAVAVAAAWSVPAGPVAVVVAAAGFGAVLLLGSRRIGGYTGDVLGAAGVVAETVGLLTAAARW